MRNFKSYIWSNNSKLYVKEVWFKTRPLPCTCLHDVFLFLSRIFSIDIKSHLWSISHNSIIHIYFFFNKCQICQIFGNESLAIRFLELNDSCTNWQLIGLTLLLGTDTLRKLIEMIGSFFAWFDINSFMNWEIYVANLSSLNSRTSQIFPLWTVGQMPEILTRLACWHS